MSKSGLNFENERGVAGLGKETQIVGFYNAKKKRNDTEKKIENANPNLESLRYR